jgi:hypothetical protein
MASRPKRKTAVLSLRVSPPVKAAAQRAAERDHRSVASFIEVLIIEPAEFFNASLIVSRSMLTLSH